MGAFESGQQFFAGVLAKLPAEQQAQAKAIFESAEAKDAVTLIGDSTLARSDYSRSMDQLREKESALVDYYQRLNTWYAENQTALDAARSSAVTGGDPKPAGGDPAPTPQPTNTGVLTRDEILRIAND